MRITAPVNSSLESTYPEIFGKNYQLQNHTYNTQYDFYAKTGTGDDVYIYYNGTAWIVSKLFVNDTLFMFADAANTTSPDQVG